MFIPRAKLCILFCNQLAFNLFGTLSPLRSVHRWVIAAALHPAKRGVSQLRGHYLDYTAIFTCGPKGGHVHISQHQTALSTTICPLWDDVAKLRRLQMSRFKISNMRWGRCVSFWSRGTGKNESGMMCFESEHYLGFLWVTEKEGILFNAPFKSTNLSFKI